MAISKLQAALGMVTNEVTVAAAQINFDFTLVKNEAPKEYHVFGESLSKRRKNEAETGRIHITARRLGALFDGVCPPTPNLMKAYGTRVSETSSKTKESSSAVGGSLMFDQFLGVDGTSIWAAATSSPSAIQVQLLACILARMFDAPESISVWVELVQDRRREIAGRFENNEELHFSVLSAAAQADITRAQLAEWDTSARAWLRTADAAKAREQKQLLLILDNLNLPVNGEIRVYSSVVAAWKASLSAMENLISGAPQAVENGAAILGLASWHVYPDMVVLGSAQSNLLMNDKLVAPGGVLTVGLQKSGEGLKPESNRGVYWSLSLAHLRYYGHPVLKQRELNSNTSRLTFDQFSQATFGCIIGNWGVAEHEIPVTVDIILAIADALKPVETFVESTNVKGSSMISTLPGWFQMITNAARQFKDSLDEEKDQIRKLIHLGQRRSRVFMPASRADSTSGFNRNCFEPVEAIGAPVPFFGLRDPTKFICCLRPEERIRYLRTVASRLPGISNTRILIRFGWKNTYALATAIPGRNPFFHDHARWYPHKAQRQKVKGRKTRIVFNPARGRRQGAEGMGSRFVAEGVVERHGNDSEEGVLEIPIPSIPGENCSELAQDELLNDRDFFIRQDPNGGHSRFDLLFGDTSTAALFASGDCRDLLRFVEEQPLDDILQCLGADMMALDDQENSLLVTIEDSTTSALRALSEAKLIYMELPGATIDVGVLNQPIVGTRWAKRVVESGGREQFNCSRETALSCIAFFETGKSDIEPENLKDVFAMSSGDSLYISEQLLCDPWEIAPGYKFKRVLGNIGQTGVTMLISAQNPMIRELDPGSWKVINHYKFNNQAEDHFAKTSLHLSFTEYYRPLDLSLRGEQDIRAGLLECVVSVHHAGKWVADIDVLTAVKSKSMDRISVSTQHAACDGNHEKELVSLENWDEILDMTQAVSVVRARGNATARLAIVSVLAQLGSAESVRVLKICPPDGELCLLCLARLGALKDCVLIY